MDSKKDMMEKQKPLEGHQIEEINDDILLDVAGGMKQPHDALQKWVKFDEKFNKFYNNK